MRVPDPQIKGENKRGFPVPPQPPTLQTKLPGLSPAPARALLRGPLRENRAGSCSRENPSPAGGDKPPQRALSKWGRGEGSQKQTA